MGVTGARTYFYRDEALCDENLQHFIDGIDAVSGKRTLCSTGMPTLHVSCIPLLSISIPVHDFLFSVRWLSDKDRLNGEL